MGSASHGRKLRRKDKGGYSKAGNESSKGDVLVSFTGDFAGGRGNACSNLEGGIGLSFDGKEVAFMEEFACACMVFGSNVAIVFKKEAEGLVEEDFGLKSRLEIIDSDERACSGFWRIEAYCYSDTRFLSVSTPIEGSVQVLMQ